VTETLTWIVEVRTSFGTEHFGFPNEADALNFKREMGELYPNFVLIGPMQLYGPDLANEALSRARSFL